MTDAANTVAGLMATAVETVDGTGTVEDAAARMAERAIGAVVVLDGDGVSGILTERDVLRLVAHGRRDTAVREAMTAAPTTVTSTATPADAYRLMADGGFRHLPVVDDGRLAGIVSMRDLLGVARLEPVEHPGELAAPKGLAGVIVAETRVGDVRGREGFYHYRQYSAVALAAERTLEDAWHLLLRGELPASLAERDAFVRETAPLRRIPGEVSELLPGIVRSTSTPLDALRAAVTAVASHDGFRPTLDASADELAGNALRITAVLPSLIAALHRVEQGLDPIAPRDDLPYVADYLAMLTGSAPDPDVARALEQYLISTIDHGFNASTFTARVIASTGADLGSSIVGAIGALSGPLHGGAPSRALQLLDEIGDPSRAEQVVREKIASGERIMGFGHRVYRTRDPRARLLREVALRVGGPLAEFAAEVEDLVVEVLAELKPGRELYANVEYYAGIVLQAAGLPPQLFTPSFAASRAIGWCAHVMEQAADNRIIRPTARYVGPPPPQPVPSLA